MRELEPILVAHLFAPLNTELVALLRSLDEEEWSARTAAGAWTVRDVAGHLLDTALRRLAMHRDEYQPTLPREAMAHGLAGFVNGMNREGVAFTKRLSPTLLIDMHERYGAEMAAFMESLDPHATAKWAVSWAGEAESPMWFDIARELTERWHHQQQIRDAVDRSPLFDYLGPVLDTFMRALPYTYRDTEAVEGTSVVLRVTGEGEGTWSLVRDSESWQLYSGHADRADAVVTMTGDAAWRLFTRQKIDPRAQVEGDLALARPVMRMVAVV